MSKGGGDIQVIGPKEVTWKMFAVILYHRLYTAIKFHGVLHGFWTGLRTRTTYLNTNLIQQLEAMMEEFLYEIFLELNKAYNDMDRNICLDILEGYIA